MNENWMHGARWLAVAEGEGCGATQICDTEAELLDFLWEQFGHDYTGDEAHARNAWREWLGGEEDWVMMDGDVRWRYTTDVGETASLMIQRVGI